MTLAHMCRAACIAAALAVAGCSGLPSSAIPGQPEASTTQSRSAATSMDPRLRQWVTAFFARMAKKRGHIRTSRPQHSRYAAVGWAEARSSSRDLRKRVPAATITPTKADARYASRNPSSL